MRILAYVEERISLDCRIHFAVTVIDRVPSLCPTSDFIQTDRGLRTMLLVVMLFGLSYVLFLSKWQKL